MTNDDSTLVIVTHDSSEDFNIVQLDDINVFIAAEKASQEPKEETTVPEKKAATTENPVPVKETKENKQQEEVPQPPKDAKNPTDIEENKDYAQNNESEDDALELIQEVMKIKWWNRARTKSIEKDLHRIFSRYHITKRNQ